MSTFSSKYDGWLLLVTALVLGSQLLVSVRIVNQPARSGGDYVMLGLAGLCWVVLVWALVATRYVVDSEGLVVRCGIYRWSAPLSSIRSVAPTHEFVSAPAWSLDRLRVTADKGVVLISPNDPARFLQALVALDPGLHLQGQSVTRGSAAEDRAFPRTGSEA